MKLEMNSIEKSHLICGLDIYKRHTESLISDYEEDRRYFENNNISNKQVYIFDDNEMIKEQEQNLKEINELIIKIKEIKEKIK